MKKFILTLMILLYYLTILANKPAINWVTDTIDYSGYRIVFNAPDYSADNSLEQCEYHGCSYFFPLCENTYTCLLVISFLRMTQWTLSSTMDFDRELWNTFGDGYEGPRCFIKDNMYSRIDRYKNGMVMIYSNIPYEVAEIANKIIDSVVIRRKTESDRAIKRTRKEIKSPSYTYDSVIDNLHISYDGNRITTVLEDADPVTQPGSMDYPGAKREMAFEYNAWGALTKDESRGIESIEYDSFGNPVYIDMKGRDYTKNVYSATGVKLKAEHYTDPLVVGPPVIVGPQQSDADPTDMEAVTGTLDPGVSQLAGQEKMEYHGPVIHRNGKIDMVLFPGGYATISGTAVTFHYYTQDYLGNNRAVVNGTTGAIEQTTAYYPYGAVIPDLGTGNTGQPYKFGGKELISANGLNMYDFGARRHYPAIPQFTSIDRFCEKYYHLSPYIYCGGNLIDRIDINGNSIAVLNVGGDIGHSAMLIQNADNKWSYYSKKW